MKNRRKNMKKRGVPLALYLTVCLAIIVSAYFHLSRIAQNFNTQHLELITGLYAEKMNESISSKLCKRRCENDSGNGE